ncbi:MAG TPA: gliding motility lipoprotein GldH [Flavobacteriales bacterium]|nr:gliding motility lipoprotein GldH [Flavobacteriales bacterium]
MNRILLAGALPIVLLTGCSEPPVFQADTTVPEGSWDRSFKPEFAFDISDTVSKHDVYIDVRHTGDYPFSDLFLFVDLEGPGGRTARDTVECLLADPSGQWYGKGTGFIFASRTEISAKVLYKLNNRFPASGRYAITLEQAMRTGKLDGVLDVGISVERSRQ